VHATGLRCLRCSAEHPFHPEAYLCPACGPGAAGEDPGVLDVGYDLAAAGEALRRRLREDGSASGLARWLPLLPVEDLGSLPPAGGTPLVPAPRLAARLGLRALYLKDETRNPTRCLKDRATAVGVALARSLGRDDLVCASAGNAAISLAGFCAQQGLRAHAFVPAGASATRLAWLERFGASVHRSEGDYDQAFDESERAREENGWFSRNCAFNPFLVEGKKTVAFEIAEQLGWRAPDLVVAPVGDGCTLGAAGKGFRELERMGFLDATPRLLGVQAAAIQPLVARFTGRAAEPAEGRTAAASIAVRRPRNALRLLAELRASGGEMRAVSDPEIAAAQDLLAREAGLVAELTSAATLAGLLRLAAEQDLAGRTAVLMITGGRVD
jgi:threonine synthase